eukprot:TRINITY_DN16430_c0_g1_i3.p1 TRINITY_DN16430_c0_g1~~TRINITY_DN16430_c0_g1_i3.p1  ORF type:complete len:360 (+),score=36.54 TRINITY_DN16430_c0_g1_i3:136-1215(+)
MGPIWLWVVVFRLFNAWFLTTAFNPDEQWQSLEVAHVWVFGYGYLSWEWEPCIALRGALHPGLFAAFYYGLAKFGADSTWMIAYGPRFLQGVLAACGDLGVYRTAQQLLGAEKAVWALAVQLGSWFQFYSMPRTYSSSLEAVIVSLAMEQWLRRGVGAPRGRALALGAVCLAFRPTAAVFWCSLALLEAVETLLLRDPSVGLAAQLPKICYNLVLPGILAVAVSLSVAIVVDSLAYGRFVFIPWHFLQFNLLQNGSALYGSHPWHWYATEGNTFLPLALRGVAACCRKDAGSQAMLRSPLISTAVSVIALSFAAHKEYRFLLPVLPLLSLVTASGLSDCLRGRGRAGRQVEHLTFSAAD